MEKVSFKQMKDGTKEDYELLGRYEERFVKDLPDRLLEMLKGLDSSLDGYQISRLEHSLQSATRAERDGADEEMIVATLLHDIGDSLAPHNHSQLVAAIIRPYVSDKTHWIIKHHGMFQELGEVFYFHSRHKHFPPTLVIYRVPNGNTEKSCVYICTQSRHAGARSTRKR